MKYGNYCRYVFVLSLAILIIAGSAIQGMAIEISAYTLNSKLMMDPVCELIQKKLGITVALLRMSGGTVWTRVMAEAPNIQADMIIGANVEHAIKWKKMGFLLNYKSNAWDIIPAEFKDKDGFYYCDGMWCVFPIVNTALIKKKGFSIPTSWYDIIDPKWKGEVIMPNPSTSSTAYLTLMGLVQLMGEEKAFEYLKKLDMNVVQYPKSGGTGGLFVARGEVTFAIADSSGTYSRMAAGFPISIAPFKEGIPYALNANFIFKSTQDPKRLAACQKVIDFLATEEYQSSITKYRAMVTNPNVIIPEKMPGVPNPKLVLLKNFDYEWMSSNLERLQKKWKENFQAK